jgi:hypothetical protein
MANELRGKQIKILRRQEDRNKRLPILLDELSKITNRQFSVNDVLIIEHIDEHQIQLNSADFNFNYLNLSFPVNKASELHKLLFVLKDRLSQTNYFTLSQFCDIAILNIKTDFIIDKFEDLIKFDKDTLTIYDHNCKNGLWIDLIQEYWYLDNKTEFIWIYELRIFGKDWIKIVNQSF